ncbi:MAG: respiratory nitrate reductase subunit gamma [Negativicutes bacterium]|nr:respiratory nitrate reductase subunit gamma [Negativicutes bacterium]
MLYFIGQVLPFIAAGVFLIGVTYRVIGWLKVPVPFQLTLFPAPKDGVGRVTAVGTELLFFKSLFHNDKTLWLWAWSLHIALAMVIGGHVVGIYYLMNQFTLVGMTPAASQTASAVLGTTAGIVLMVALIVLFYRRIAEPEVKRLSDPADYVDIMFLLSIVITGNHMRLPTVHVNLPAIKSYLGGLFTLSPTPIPTDWVFVVHFTLVNLFLIYFPFSKMLHFAGYLVNRAMLVEAPPVYPTPAGTSLRSPFAGTISSPTAPAGQPAGTKGV